jgi:hypothetical protein
MILQWERIHNDPCLLCFKYVYCFHYALNTIYCFPLCFKYHLLLLLRFKYIYCFLLCFKYIYCFHLHLLRIYDYPISPCDSGMKILIGLGGLCKTFIRH